MASKNSTLMRTSKKLKDEIERIKKVISKELGVPQKKVKTRDAEEVLLRKASRGKIMDKELNDILLGKLNE